MLNSNKNAIRDVRSAGGVVIGNGRKVLFCHPTGTRSDNWRMPKGRIGEGENTENAALREVAEETGFHCRILRKLESEAEYRSRDEDGTIWKKVTLYLMEPLEEVRKPDGEMDTFKWVSPSKIRQYAAENELPMILEAIEAYNSLYPPPKKKSDLEQDEA